MDDRINVYIDSESRRAIEREADGLGLSFSPYLRVVAKFMRTRIDGDTLMKDLRDALKKIAADERFRMRRKLQTPESDKGSGDVAGR